MSDPFRVVRDFESALCEYTGAPFAVTTTSCTMALLLTLKAAQPVTVSIPARTYIGVAMSILNAGHRVDFRDDYWSGEYCLEPSNIWDCARWLRAGMYRQGSIQCLSFHWTKHLSIGQGGAVLHDDAELDAWLRRMRFDGRTEGMAPKDDSYPVVGLHAYMSPRDAAEGLTRLATLPRDNAPLPWGPGTNSDYPDLSRIRLFL